MIAELGQPPRLQNKDYVRILDGAQRVRHGDRGPLLRSFTQIDTLASKYSKSLAATVVTR